MKRGCCTEDMLIAYCYQELSPKETDKIKGHLAVCAKCSSQVRAIQKTLTLVAQERLQEVPSDLLNDYTQTVREKISQEKHKGWFFALRERFVDSIENVRFVFFPRLVPAGAEALPKFEVVTMSTSIVSSPRLLKTFLEIISSITVHIFSHLCSSNSSLLPPSSSLLLHRNA